MRSAGGASLSVRTARSNICNGLGPIGIEHGYGGMYDHQQFQGLVDRLRGRQARLGPMDGIRHGGRTRQRGVGRLHL